MGAMGVVFQPNLPTNSSCADLFLVRRKNRNMFNVNSTCGRKLGLGFMVPGLSPARTA